MCVHNRIHIYSHSIRWVMTHDSSACYIHAKKTRKRTLYVKVVPNWRFPYSRHIKNWIIKRNLTGSFLLENYISYERSRKTSCRTNKKLNFVLTYWTDEILVHVIIIVVISGPICIMFPNGLNQLPRFIGIENSSVICEL